MKLFLFTLLFPLICFSKSNQDSVPGTALVLKNNTILFQKVYTSKLTQEELSKQLNVHLATLKKFKLNDNTNQSKNDLTGSLRYYKVDARKYSTSIFNSPAILAFPLNASVIIQVKDYKYRVIVSAITFKEVRTSPKEAISNPTLEEYLTEKRRSQIKTGKSALRLAQVIDQDFSDAFDLQKSIVSADF